MSNRRYGVVAVLAFVLLALALASASITGSISGVVTDKSGAVISGATVVATEIAPISQEMVLNFLSQRALHLPKSY